MGRKRAATKTACHCCDKPSSKVAQKADQPPIQNRGRPTSRRSPAPRPSSVSNQEQPTTSQQKKHQKRRSHTPRQSSSSGSEQEQSNRGATSHQNKHQKRRSHTQRRSSPSSGSDQEQSNRGAKTHQNKRQKRRSHAPRQSSPSSGSDQAQPIRGTKSHQHKRQKRRRRPRSPSSGSDQEPPIMVSETESDSSIDEVVDDHARHLTGNVGQSYAQFQYRVTLSNQINTKLKRKIWNNKYIDFADLLPSHSHSNTSSQNQNFQIQLNQAGSNFSIVPTSKKAKINNIEQWTTAFLRFVAIYTTKSPTESPALMKYGEQIRGLAHKNHTDAWFRYDHEFRMLRAESVMPWDMIHQELRSDALTPVVPAPFLQNRRYSGAYSSNQNRSNNHYQPQQTQYCWQYDRRGFCQRQHCKKPHICSKCKGPHPSKHCRTTNTQQNTQPRHTATPSNKPQTSKPKPF